MKSDNLANITDELAESVASALLNLPPTAEKICPRCDRPFIYRSDIPKPAPTYCLLCVRR